MTASASHGGEPPGTTGAERRNPPGLARLPVAKRVKLRCLIGHPWLCGPTGGA